MKIIKFRCPRCGEKNDTETDIKQCHYCDYKFTNKFIDSVISSKTKKSKKLKSKKVKKDQKAKNLNRRLVILITLIALFLISFASYFSGHLSYVFNIATPIIGINEKQTNLYCNYKGDEINLTVNLYDNQYNYYRYNNKRRKFNYSGDFSIFTHINKHDNSIAELAERINRAGVSHGYKDDQILEIASCFVQNIPYDEEKSKRVLEGAGNTQYTEQFPYETLYLNKGICTDKAYLASTLIRELGYSTALLSFPEDQHLTLGIRVPSMHADFGHYAILDVTTPGFRPGLLPSSIEDNTGKPVSNITNLTSISKDSDPRDYKIDSSQRISDATQIIELGGQKEYLRIVDIKNLENKIYTDLAILEVTKKELDKLYANVINWQNQLNYSESVYNSTPSMKYDCGYNYEWDWYSASYEYKYSCDYVTNPIKSYKYNDYLYDLRNYNNAVSSYNGLLSSFNEKVGVVRINITKYHAYSY